MASDGAVTDPNINRAEHDQVASAKRVEPLYYDPGSLSWSASSALTSRFDIEGTIIYVGEALVGTATSAANWTITKYDITDLTAASGKVAVASSWDTRTSGTYL